MGPSDNFVGDRRYPFGQSMKTERVIYEPPPPPPKHGEYPRKPQYWNLTATKIGKDLNSGTAFAVAVIAAFGAAIIYYGDPKMNRFLKHLTGSSRITPDKIEMDHARKHDFLRSAAGMNVDIKTYDVALQRMNQLQSGVNTTIDWAHHDAGMRWYATQPEFGVTKD